MDYDTIKQAALRWDPDSRTELWEQLQYSLKGLSEEQIRFGEDRPLVQREEAQAKAARELGKYGSILPQEMLSLPARERNKLAKELKRSIDEDIAGGWVHDEEWEEAWRIEIERRVRESDEGKVKSIPWEEVRKELWGHIRRELKSAPKPVSSFARRYSATTP